MSPSSTAWPIAELCKEAIIAIDRDGRIEYLNPAAIRTFFSRPGTFVRKPIASIFPENHRSFVLNEIEKVQRGAESWEGKVEFTGAHGETRFGQLQITTIRRTEESKQVVLLLTDLTLHDSMTLEIETLKHRMSLAMRLASLSESNLLLTHSLSTPAQVLERQYLRIQEICKSLEAPWKNLLLGELQLMERSVLYSQRTLRALQHIARGQEESTEQKVSLQNILEEAIEFCGDQFSRRDIQLKMEIESEVFFIKGSAASLLQSILILLSNALDASAPTVDKWIHLSLSKQRGWAELKIVDSGPGVPSACRNRIFEPFFSTKPLGQGSGLGLYFAKKIAIAHGGELLHSSGVSPTTFCLRLPLEETNGPKTPR